MFIFLLSKSYLKSASQWHGISTGKNYVEGSTSKWRRFFVHENYIEQSMSKRRRIFAYWNYSEKVRRNDVEIFSIFSCRRIDVISTSDRCRFGMLYLLGAELCIVPPVITRLELFESQKLKNSVKPAWKSSENVTFYQPVTRDTGQTSKFIKVSDKAEDKNCYFSIMLKKYLKKCLKIHLC